MSNISKLTNCIFLSLIILGSKIPDANAFFLIPPMPWDIEINIPGNANKVVSNIKSYYRQIQALKTGENTEILKSVKIGNVSLNEIINKNISSMLPENEKKGENKTISKGAVVENGTLGISKDSIDEREYYDAYYKLFFLLPEKSSYSGSYKVLESAFDEKRLDYQQDVIIDTYLYGRMNEDFLVLINKTVDRLDRCRIGELKDNDCIFFGMQYVYSDPLKEAPQGTEDEDSGSLGESMNAYIVSTVYDRLLRIIEDMTAVEAIYNASKQIELVEPMKTSDASNKVSSKFQFAYKTTTTYSNAKLDFNDYLNGGAVNSKEKRSAKCENGGEGCAKINKTQTETSSIEETEILRQLQPIDDYLAQVMVLHNLKKELPEYKDEYRKYLKSREIHERSLKTLQDSDSCVEKFIQRHNGDATLWGAPTKANDHEARSGLSKELIKEYDNYITDKILDNSTNGICDGYYAAGTCPVGYRTDDENSCPDDSSKYACIVDTIPTDTAKAEEGLNTDNANDTDGFLDAPQSDAIENDNRMKAERSWRIGSKAVEDLTKEGKLTFKQWTDQQNIQKEYMRNKYRNIRIIIETTDKARASYRVGWALSKLRTLNIAEEPIEGLLKKVTSVKTPQEAVADGSAVKYAIENLGLCSGFIFNGSIGTKTITTTYTVNKTCYGTNEDGETYSYACPETKHDELTLKCTAMVSAATGYADIKQENYKQGTRNSLDAPTITTKAVDLRIKNDPAQYPSDLSKAPSSIKDMVSEHDEPRCSTTWDFTVYSIVKDFFPTVLGECQDGLDAQELALYETAKGKGRIVAKDLLDEVIETRKEEEKKVKKQLEADKKKVEALEAKRASQIASLNYWTNQAKSDTQKKNDVISLKRDTEKRISSITSEISSLTERTSLINDKKANYGNMASDSAEIAEQKKEMLNIELNCLQNGKNFCKQCSNYKTCKDDVEVKSASEENTFISIKNADNQIEKLDKTLTTYNTNIKNIQDDIKVTEQNIEKAKNDLAENYVKISEEAQTAIEEENKKYEAFVEKDSRMEGPERCSGWGPFKSCKKFKGDDGLEKTITEVLDDTNDDLKEYVAKNIEKIWLKDTASISQFLSSMGIPDKIKIGDGNVDLGMGMSLAAGKEYTIDALISTLKEQIKDKAATEIANNIKKADVIMTQELEAAVQEVDNWAGSMLCLPGNGEAETSSNCQDDKNTADSGYDYTKYENYGNGGAITGGHATLIENLKKPTPANAGIIELAQIDMGELFGIIPDTGIDTEYFVALPARGLEKGKEFLGCVYDKAQEDSYPNDGCDYKSPRAPLAITPPLREVFYFSALDHDDIPSEGKQEVGETEIVKTPSISHLLEQKEFSNGEKYEYLPEVWRYLLARPNLRDDGKYQQTYIERGYGIKELNEYLKGFKEDEVNATLSRGGIYPCSLTSMAADIVENKEISKVKIGKRSGGGRVTCKEIAIYEGKVQHLLADFNPNKRNNPALSSFGTSNKPEYDKQSELAQFLEPEKKCNKKLRYRNLLRSTFALLKDVKKEDEDSNNFTRQMAETTSFKRNVMGSFIENVNAEFNTRKTMNNATEDVKKTLSTLCEQIHKTGQFVGDEYDLEGDEEKTNSCIDIIMQGNGLATSSSDKNYDKDKTYYGTILELLDGQKNTILNDAKNALKELKGKYADTLDKVDERIKEIEDLIKAFEGDSNEIIYLKPGDNENTVDEAALNQAKAEREATLVSVEEAILSMDNQSRSVAYCPVY